MEEKEQRGKITTQTLISMSRDVGYLNCLLDMRNVIKDSIVNMQSVIKERYEKEINEGWIDPKLLM